MSKINLQSGILTVENRRSREKKRICSEVSVNSPGNPWSYRVQARCQKLVHKKCSGIKGSMSKVAKSFICRGCLNPVTSAVRTSVDIGASAKLELVDKFCYLGVMFSVDGDADAAVEPELELVGISSGSWYHCLPISTCL